MTCTPNTQAPERVPLANRLMTDEWDVVGAHSPGNVMSKGYGNATPYVRADLAGWRDIESAPKDGSTIALLDMRGQWLSPCVWSAAGEISENGFWLWWQVEPECLTEVHNPQAW